MPSAREPRYKAYQRELQGNAAQGIAGSIAEEKGLALDELLEFAQFLGVDPAKEAYLLTVVAESCVAPLPADWIECEDEATREVYYSNQKTLKTTWEHPLDQYYKNLLFVERKNYKERKKSGGARNGPDPRKAAARPAQQAGGGGGGGSGHGGGRGEGSGGGGRGEGGGSSAASKLYLEGALEARDREIATLQKELQESAQQDRLLKQGEKVKESRLLKEQVSKLQRELAALRTSSSSHTQQPPNGAGAAPTANMAVLGRQLSQLRRAARSARADASGIRAEMGQWASMVDELRRVADHRVALACIGMAAPAGGGSGGGGVGAGAEVVAENRQLRAEAAEAGPVRRRAQAEVAELRAENARLLGTASRAGGEAEDSSRRLAVQAERLARAEQELADLRSAAPAAQAGSGDDRGDAEAPGLREVAELQRRLDESTTALSDRETELCTRAEMEMASFEIERNALVADNKALQQQADQLKKQAGESKRQAAEANGGLEQQLDELRRHGASASAGADQAVAGVQAELANTTADRNRLAAEAAGLQQTVAELEAAKLAARAAAQAQAGALAAAQDELTAALAAAGGAKSNHDSKVAGLKKMVQGLQTEKEGLEGTLAGQAEQMKAREQKAASECERMFKLVQSAHEKVTGKEKEFKAQLAAEKQKFATEVEGQVAVRMVSIQAKYEEEAALRRKLFNQVQELKGNIRVYCRVRPCLGAEASEEKGIDFEGPYNDLLVRNPRAQLPPKKFEFEHVFRPESTQAGLFAEVSPLVTSVLDGFNVCIFAYGQTGSGKTFTMEGPLSDRGVYFLSMQELFDVITSRQAFEKTEISVSLLEIYNEQIRDLLVSRASQENLEIRRGPRGAFVPGLTTVPVTHAEEVMSVLAKGNEERSVASTKMNAESSRSHSMLVVNITMHRRDANGQIQTTASQLTLVDLAGSERLSKSEATGQARKEAQHINKSLSALADVIAARATKQAHIPYRNSKLTSLLQDSLGGDSKTLMLVHCRPTADNLSETICTLNFASRVRAVELGAATVQSAR